MNIKINQSDLNRIRKHGEEDYPHECCGFLFGKTTNGYKNVIKTHPVLNSRDAEKRHNRYLIPPQAYLKADREARDQGLDIIGFYHSHPDAEARPSQYDLDYSWPVYSYLIVSVKNRRAEETTSWQLKDDRSEFIQEEIVFETVSLEVE